MKLQPVHDRVVVKRHEMPDQTESGLYVPPVAKGESNFAVVIAVGPGRTTGDGVFIPTAIKVGDTVLIGKWQGDEITVDGQKCLILREDQILATVN